MVLVVNYGGNMDNILKVIGAVFVGLLLVGGVALLGAYPTKWIVNYLFTSNTLVGLFGITQLTFWKAFWLNWLCASLFKSVNTQK